MHRKSIQSVLAAGAVSLLVAGCGSSGEGGGGKTGGAGGSAASTASEVYAEMEGMKYEERLALLEEKAAEEGRITLYSSRDDDLLEAMKVKFEKLYPDITVQYLSGENPEIFSRIQQEGKGSNAVVDVVLSDLIPAMKNEGFLADIYGVPIPSDYPEEAVGENYMQLGPSPTVMAWNTDLVSEAEVPQSYQDFLDPKWKGKFALEAKPDHMITAMVIKWGEEETREFMAKLMENEPLVRKGHSNVNQLLAAGEFPIAMEVFAHKTSETIAKGAPVDFRGLDPVPNGANAFGIAEYAPNPYAAALFSHFILTKPGAEILAADGRLVNTPGVEPLYPRAAELADDPTIVIVDPFAREEANKIALSLIGEYVTPAFTG
jgi:iron(III) transport system substrate-binding protein